MKLSRFIHVLAEGFLVAPGQGSGQIIDLRDPDPKWTKKYWQPANKPYHGATLDAPMIRGWWHEPPRVHLALQTDGSTVIFRYGDGNTIPWAEVMNRANTGLDSTLQKDMLDIVVHGNGIVIDSSRSNNPTAWAGNINKHSEDTGRVAQALLDRGLITPTTRISLGRWVRPEQAEYVGTAGSLLKNKSRSKLVLYHGTSNYRAAFILRDGLRPIPLEGRVWNKGGADKQRPAHREDSVYLSAVRRQAEYYAEKAVKVDRTRYGPAAHRTHAAFTNNVRQRLDRIDGLLQNPSWLRNETARMYHYRLHYSEQDAAVTPEQIEHTREMLTQERAKQQAELDQRNAGMMRADVSKFEPVLLQITIPKSEFGRLMGDDDWLAKHRHAGTQADPTDWIKSLGEFGQIAYRGTIPPNWITVLAGTPGTVSESLEQVTIYKQQRSFLLDPTAQEVIGFMRRYAKGCARIVITPQHVLVWSAFEIVHEDMRLALSMQSGMQFDHHLDGVLSLTPEFQADPGMWSVPRRLGAVWYEFDPTQSRAFIAQNPVWMALQAGLERMQPDPVQPQPDPVRSPAKNRNAEIDDILKQLGESVEPLKVRGGTVPMLVNPSYQQLLGLVRKSKVVRALEGPPEGTVAWDGNLVDHSPVQWAIQDQWGWFKVPDGETRRGFAYVCMGANADPDEVDYSWRGQPKFRIGELLLYQCGFENGRKLSGQYETEWIEQLQRAVRQPRMTESFDQITIYKKEHILHGKLKRLVEATKLDGPEIIAHVQALGDQYNVDIQLSMLGSDQIELEWIRNNGERRAGRTVMNELCRLADQSRIRIALAVLDGAEELVAYYRSFGFEFIPGKEDWSDPEMIRMPSGLMAGPNTA